MDNVSIKDTWISPKVEIKVSSIGGKGVFATDDIIEGETVVVIGGAYTDKIGANIAQSKGKLVMQWDEDLFSFEERGDDDSYFINHSCDPNVWMIDAYTLGSVH